VRLGSSLSVLDFAQVGSTLSVRSWGRLGSWLSVIGFTHLGSSLALRSFARLGSSLAIYGMCRSGSTLAIYDSIYVGSCLHFGTSGTHIRYDAATAELHVSAGGQKRMSLSATGGNLHGTWHSESIISASDRRLKRDVVPLQQVLITQMPRDQEGSHASLQPSHPTGSRQKVQQSNARHGTSLPEGVQVPLARSARPGAKAESRRAVDWLLRELRPVSFAFRSGPEAKFARYGFIAQELETVLPDLVRTDKDQKYVVYQDLIAVLTLTSQVQHGLLNEQEKAARLRSARLDVQARKIARLQQGVAGLTARIGRWEARAAKGGGAQL